MLNFTTNIENFTMDLLDEVKLFLSPNITDDSIAHTLTVTDTAVINTVRVNGKSYEFLSDVILKANPKQLKRTAKHAVYSALSFHYNKHLPYGSLTGVRPTKLAYEFFNSGGSITKLPKYLKNTFDVSTKRAKLICDVIASQSPHINPPRNAVNLYIHVPLCTSRCNYCSFPSAIVKSGDDVLSSYTKKLCDEIIRTLEIIETQNKTVLSVYIGGGTPSILPPNLLKMLLGTTQHLNAEFTFEAGRADSIISGTLETLREHKVTRICINPQSLSDATLSRIGRNHTAAQFYTAFEAARAARFDINVDLIAGLDGESLSDFAHSLSGVINLAPENITVHTLSRKRASDNAFKTLTNDGVEDMINHSISALPLSGYRPYYLYKQKYMLGNLENIGYCLPDKECINNITVMEELVSVYACGAGAISKLICGNKITRHQNAKDIKLYIDEFDARMNAKYKFLLGD